MSLQEITRRIAAAEAKAVPDIAVERADNGNPAGRHRKVHGLDHRAVVGTEDQGVLGQIRADRGPARRRRAAAGAHAGGA